MKEMSFERVSLIRNAVKASTTIDRRASGSSVHIHNYQDAHQGEEKERWMIMTARSGLHPSDYTEDSADDNEEEEGEEGNDEVILLPRIENKDYYYTSMQIENQGEEIEDENENEWFDGLLQEVRSVDQGPTSPCSLEDDEERHMSLSSTPSLPSLIMDEDDDTSEEDEGDEADIPIQIRNHSKSSPTTPLY